MTRRVGRWILSQRAPVAEKEQRIIYTKKDSEQRTGIPLGEGGSPGAPVTELEYTHCRGSAVLEEAYMATYRQIWGGTTRI